jgi:transketolase
MFRAIPGAVVFYPCDGVSAERVTEIAARIPGITYIRTSRPKTALLYSATEEFPVPGFKVLRQSANDAVTIIAAGITVHESLKACDQLKAKGIAARVVDLYCVKPLDGAKLGAEIRSGQGNLVTVEDHYHEGGIGEAVLAALADAGVLPTKVKRLAVDRVPHSGKPDELIDKFGISARHIAAAVESLK